MSNQTQDDAIQIHAWTAVGAMTPEAILARIDQNIIDKRTFRPSELAALRRNFQAVCDNKGQISKAEFTSFVLSKSSFPAALAEAVHVLFESLCYLSGVPLQSTSSSSPSTTTHLTIEGLTRALMWLLPSRVTSVITETSSGLMRSPADHRRLIFQSLATSQVAHAPEETRSVASLGPRQEAQNQAAETNVEDHGDEMYHDILDTLASTQPHIPPSFAPPSRDTFHALATKLHQGAPSLSSLAISKERLTSFLSLLLANNFLERLLDVGPDLQAVAHAMAASFCHGRQDGQITWEMYDFAAAELLPHVFDSLFNLLGTIFFDQLCELDATQGHFPTAEGGRLLTLPRMAQLESFMFNSICMADIRLFDSSLHPHKTTASDLVDAIEKIPECALLVVSGHTAAHDTCTFGVFIARPLVDGPCIQHGEPGFEDTALLIQLSPVHDFFRGQIGGPAWAATDEGLVFGNTESGAALVLDGRMANAQFMHNPFGSTGDITREATYQATKHRGKFSIPFTVDKIELWGEDPQ